MTSDSAGPSDSLPPVLMRQQHLLAGREQSRGKRESSGQVDCKHKHMQSIFPRNPPQCRIHGAEVSREFSTNHPPQAELLQRELNWAIHPRGSTKMSLFIQLDYCVWFSFTWISETSSLNLLSQSTPYWKINAIM